MFENKKLMKIICLTLVILTLAFTPIIPFVKSQKAYASVTLTAAALTILKYVIPIVASYVCLNVIGKTYQNSDLQNMINKLTEQQETIWLLLSNFARLSIFYLINNVQNLGRNIAELANDLGITNTNVITQSQTYVDDDLYIRTAETEALQVKDIVNLDIVNITNYAVSKIVTDSNFISNVEPSGIAIINGVKYYYKDINQNIINNLSQLTNSIGYLNIWYNRDYISEGIYRFSPILTYTFELNNKKYKLEYMGNNSSQYINTISKTLDLTNTEIIYSNSYSKAYMNEFVNNTWVYLGEKILYNVGTKLEKTQLLDYVNQYVNYDLTSLDIYTNDNILVKDILGFELLGQYTIAGTNVLTGDKSVPMTMPLYPTGSICNDDVWELVNPTTDRTTLGMDTTLVVGEDGSITVTPTNPTLDGVPISVGDDVLNPEFPDVDDPAIPGEDVGTGDGEIVADGGNWILRIPVIGSILKVLQDIWEWLKSIPTMLMQLLTSLFVPSPNFFVDYFNRFQTFFGDRFSLLFFPITLIIDLANRYLNISNNQSLVIQMQNPISIPIAGTSYVLIPAFRIDLNEMYSTGGFKTIRDYILLFTDCIIAFGLINLLQRKYKEVIEK